MKRRQMAGSRGGSRSGINSFALALMLLTGVVAHAYAQEPGQKSFALRDRVDAVVNNTLKNTGAPGAAIAIVREGKIVYEHAYGAGRVTPPTPATSSMRFSIGSVSKQFTAAAVLLLAEDKRLSLDDKVSKWLPDLTRAGEVTIRQLLSMTAGYQDYWPQDYVFPAMLKPVAPQQILDQWARKPLDFAPGEKWQYSNTNYVIAGLIVEKAGGQPLFDFMRKRIFAPLGMNSVQDINDGPLGAQDAAGHLRNALGPLRPAPKEANGWLFAAGSLAMTAHDLALWDISVINQTLLKPASYRAMQTDTLLNNGLSTRYGLGVNVANAGGRRQVSHGGAVSGYLTANMIYPEEQAAVVVFVNIYPGAAGPDGDIANGIARLLFEKEDNEAAQALEQARRIFMDLRQGKIDRRLLSSNASAYFTAEVLADYAASLGPLDAPTTFTQTGQNFRGGMRFRGYRIKCGAKTLSLTVRILPDGKIEQYLVDPAE